LIFAAIVAQVLIYRKQWAAMAEGLAIERAKTNPRLRVAEVVAEPFEVGKRPFYIVTIANDGQFAATNVRFYMSIKIGDETPMEWIDVQIVTIPANGREHYFIHSSFWLSQEQFDSFDTAGVPLKVEGFFDYKPIGITNFCYKYVPVQGEYRPPKVPQFVTCDFTPRLNTTLRISGIEMELTGGSVGFKIEKATPEVTPPQEEAKPDSEDEGKKPN
jgi:hypothetical protein